MTLSILCITRAEPFAVPFLHEMARVATVCDGQLVVAFDGPPQCGCDTALTFDAPNVVTIQVKS